MQKIIMTLKNDYVSLILRLALGLMIIPHGAQKLFGMFGGYGFDGTMNFFTQTMGLPWILSFLVIVGEFFGGVALIIGLLSRVFAAIVGVIMFFAAALVHIKYGFFMNWFGNQKGEGVEFFLLAIAISLAIVIKGGGAFSMDSYFSKRMKDQNKS